MAILAIDTDDDRDYITELYLNHKPLMYRVAQQFFAEDPTEMEDTVSTAVVSMCKYVSTIRALPQERVPSYLVQIVRNACHSQLRKRYVQNKRVPAMLSLEEIHDIADDFSPQEAVLSQMTAMEMLHSFRQLNSRDRELIRMRHIDMLEYEEIAEILQVTPASARTALYRAKKRLESFASTYIKEEHP